MVTFVQIAEYLLSISEEEKDKDKEQFVYYKRVFQRDLLIEYGIVDSRTVNNYWKKLEILGCHENIINCKESYVFDITSLETVLETVIRKQKKSK